MAARRVAASRAAIDRRAAYEAIKAELAQREAAKKQEADTGRISDAEWRGSDRENAEKPSQRVIEPPKDFSWNERQAEAWQHLTGSARHTMLYGGSRSGKTFQLCAALVLRALKDPTSRHVIFRHRFNHLKTSIGFDTFPKVMETRFPGIQYTLNRTDWYFEIQGGSRIYLAGLDDKQRTEKILGQEYATLYFNECSQISYDSVLMARTRLAQKTKLTNRAYYDCNPPGSRHWTALVFVGKKDPASRPAGAPIRNPDNYTACILNPDANKANLSPEYLAELDALPPKQRERFLLGKFTSELDNALWSIDSFRRTPSVSDQVRVVVSVDPSGASGKEDKRSDEIGIICAAKHLDGSYSVLADRTMRGSPEQWAKAAVALYDEFNADCIVAEANFGGDMVRATLHQVASGVPVRIVKASRSKVARAEPISALYAKGIVAHSPDTDLGTLEDQLVNMTTAGYMGERSPDRADALVWALAELSGNTKSEISFEVI